MKVTIGLAIASAVTLGYFIFLFLKYLRVVTNLFLGISIRTTPMALDNRSGEEVRFKSAEGPELKGFLVRNRTNAPALGMILFCHEFGSDGKSVLQYAGFMLDAGFDLFGFDFQGHGASQCSAKYEPRHWATNHETADVLGAIAYLRGRSGLRSERLGLFGISRGGAAALAASAADGHIRAVVCDSTFSTWATLNDYMRRWVSIYAYLPLIYSNLPGWVFSLLGYSTMRLSEIRLNLRFVRLEKAPKRFTGSAMFLHGERDTYISASQARYLSGLTAGKSQYHVFSGAKHNTARFTDGDRYSKLVREFFVEHLVSGRPAGVSLKIRGS